MSMKIVDASKLDNSLVATATAIRRKTGESDLIEFEYEDELGFSKAIKAIPEVITVWLTNEEIDSIFNT